jgi:hypothetical protein
MVMPLNEYQPGSKFPGKIGRTVDGSRPAWPAPQRAQDGAPNILFFVLDDVGYGQLTCRGQFHSSWMVSEQSLADPPGSPPRPRDSPRPRDPPRFGVYDAGRVPQSI